MKGNLHFFNDEWLIEYCSDITDDGSEIYDTVKLNPNDIDGPTSCGVQITFSLINYNGEIYGKINDTKSITTWDDYWGYFKTITNSVDTLKFHRWIEKQCYKPLK
jgi:hypothetical protein